MTQLTNTLEFVAGTDKFDPNVAVRDYDMSGDLNHQRYGVTFTQLESSTTAAVLLLLVLTQVILLSFRMKELQQHSDLADATADTIVIGGDFNSGVNPLTSNALHYS